MTTRLRGIALSALACLLACAPVRAEEAAGAAFRAGERWAAVGDSITHSGSYHAWVWLYHLTRFPGRPLEALNAGIAGDTAAGGVRRFAWDIAPARASVATVMFGMNDVGRHLYAATATGDDLPARRRAALEAYAHSLRALVALLEGQGTRVILLTPSLFDETAELPAPKTTGVNAALAECAAIVRRLAAEGGRPVIDLHGPTTRLTAERQRSEPAFTLTSADRIHPATPGHLVLAYHVLRAQGVPAEVSHLALDARAGRVREARNGALSELRAEGGGLAFTWAARALPFPGDESFGAALAWVPFAQDLNRETLQVAGLAAGEYALTIDGAAVGRYSAAALARGVDLAGNPRTPQHRQAVEVLRLVQQHRLHVTETARNLALVEHQCAPAAGQPYTLETAQPYYAPRLAELVQTQPPTSNLLRIYRLYPELKPRAAADRARAHELAEAARRAAQPRPRAYALVRLP